MWFLRRLYPLILLSGYVVVPKKEMPKELQFGNGNEYLITFINGDLPKTGECKIFGDLKVVVC